MDYRQKEAAVRWKRIAAAREWVVSTHKTDRGFADWYEKYNRSDVYADAYADWLKSPARIEWWAERSGSYVGKGFARWYIATGRTDPWSDAYELYRALPARDVLAQLEAARDATETASDTREGESWTCVAKHVSE